MGVTELLVRGHVFGVREFAIERHDRTEGVTFRNQSQLTWGKVVILTMTVHFSLLDCSQIVLEEVLYRELHSHSPDILPVVEDPRVLLLLLSAIEEASHQADEAVLKDPLENPPENPYVLVLEVAGILS